MILKEIYARRDTVSVYFLVNYNKQEGTGKFIYTPLILDNKQLLSNMIDCKCLQKIFYPTIAD